MIQFELPEPSGVLAVNLHEHLVQVHGHGYTQTVVTHTPTYLEYTEISTGDNPPPKPK